MKWTKYNYLFKSDKFGYLLYNSLSNSFAELDEDCYNLLNKFGIGEDVVIEDKELYNYLIDMKVLVENDKDEFYNIKYQTHFNRFNDKHLGLTINPTLHCNFACAYCFETSKPAIYMTDEVENAIIEFIKKAKRIETIHITWFGGEPLMAYDRIVSITNKIKKLKVKYNADIITNGYLLNEKIINNLDKLNIKRIQITIDGLKEDHDKTRPLLSGKGTFDRIYKNIQLLKTLKPDFPTIVRVNIDVHNAQNFIKTYAFFYQQYKDKVFVVPGFIQSTGGCVASDCVFDKEKMAKFLLTLFKQYGVNAMGLFPDNYRYECPIRNPFNLVIGPESELYKCWNDIGNREQVVGYLNNQENINNKLLTRYYVAGDPFDDAECQECFHLPTCGGGCPYARIEREYNKFDENICDYRKGHLKEFLELHYDYIQQINKQNNT